jgi:hypothetical protein
LVDPVRVLPDTSKMRIDAGNGDAPGVGVYRPLDGVSVPKLHEG